MTTLPPARPAAGSCIRRPVRSILTRLGRPARWPPPSAAHILARLREHGVERIYGYPGRRDQRHPRRLPRAGDELEFVQAAHEELAAFMACAHAKFTGEVGVCLATSGPGAIHLLNGLYDAKLDHQPVVAIVGQQQRDRRSAAATSRRSTC